MTRYSSLRIAATAMLVLAFTVGSPLKGQVGKGAILDANTAVEKDLLALPNMTPAIVKGLLEKRPFASVVELNAFLTSQSLTPAQVDGVLRQGVRPREPEHGDSRRDPPDSRRGEAHGP